MTASDTTMLDAMLPVPRTCCSDLDLDRLLVGELDRDQEAALRAHLAASKGCQELYDAAAAEQQRLAAAGRRAELPPRGAARAWTRRARFATAGGGALTAFAAAAALFVVLRVPAEDERLKGAGGALSVFVQHQGVARQARPGEIIFAGDKLRFSVQASSPTHVALIARDGAGVVSQYWPAPVDPVVGADAPAAKRVDARGGVALDGAIELDDVVGPETLFAFFCADALPTSALAAIVGRSPKDSQAIRTPTGCTLDIFPYEKVARVDADR